jgi:hypothetical protein
MKVTTFIRNAGNHTVMCHILGGGGFQVNSGKIVQTRCSPLLFTDCHPDTVAHFTKNTVCVCVCVFEVGPWSGRESFASAQGLQDVSSSVFNKILFVLPARSSQHRLNVTFVYRHQHTTRVRAPIDTKHGPEHQSI